MELKDSQEEMENNQKTGNYLSLCLICGSEKCKQLSDDGGGINSGLSKQLNVIYILKHLLQVPSLKLQQFLKKCGNPDNWISLCDNCTKYTRKAREYHLKIVEIQRKEKSIQKEIIYKVKRSSSSLSSLVKLTKPKNNREQYNIWKETRKFVETYNYGNFWDDPLLKGNKHLKSYEAEVNKSPTPVEIAAQVKVEAQLPDIDVDVFPFPHSPFSTGGDAQTFSDDWLPSPSPLLSFEESLVNVKNDMENSTNTTTISSQPPVKRGRGRPRKIKTESDAIDQIPTTTTITPAPPPQKPSKVTEIPEDTASITPVSKRGRPLKVPPKAIIEESDHDDSDEWVPSPAEANSEQEDEEGADLSNDEYEGNPRSSSSTSTGNRELKKCPHCSSTFKNTTKLFCHMTATHDIHSFLCGLPGCSAKLKNAKQFHRHRREIHKPDGSRKVPKVLKRLSKKQKRILRKELKPLPPSGPQDTTPTPCHLCGETVPLCDLNSHLFTHRDNELALAAEEGATSSNGTYKCPVVGCKIEYNTEKGYQKHLQDKHGGSVENPIRQFKCSFCPREFCHRRKWREHEETHKNADTKPYKCDYCDKTFTISKYRDHHVRYSHTNKRTKCSGPDGTDLRIKETFHCPHCTAIYPFYTRLFHHIQNEHQKQRVNCFVPGCLRSFETPKQFAKHRARHKTVKNSSLFCKEQEYHQCIHCDAKFLFPATLLRHFKSQHGMDRIPCLENDCMKTFATAKQYQKHKRYCHPKGDGTQIVKKKKEKGPRVLCDLCGGSFSNREYLRSHKAYVHEGKKRVYSAKSITCHLCGDRVLGGHLKMHMRKKHKELEEFQKETFKCPVVGCKVEYVRKDLYEKHMVERHGSGEGGEGAGWRKPFSCEFCGKGFCHRRKLKQHELIHRNQGNPSFLCPDCGKGFITSRYLQYHRAYTHEGRKRLKKRGGVSGEREFGEVKNEEDLGDLLLV